MHSAGSIKFDDSNHLYIGVGDNTDYLHTGGWAPIHGGIEKGDARRTRSESESAPLASVPA
jgi:glucose/arabinose dehydrogenase